MENGRLKQNSVSKNLANDTGNTMNNQADITQAITQVAAEPVKAV